MDYTIQEDITVRSNMASSPLNENDIISEYLSEFRNSDHHMAEALEYLHTLDKYDKMAMAISIQLLKTSFDLFKSNGFVAWEKDAHKKEKRD